MADSSSQATQISILARPGDANTIGTIFGGRIMEWMDMAAAICARRHTRLRVATVAVEDMKFLQHLSVGLVINLTATITRTFGTSLEVEVQVHGEDTYDNRSFLAASAYFVIVGLDQDGSPVQVPEYTPETDLEIKKWQEAGVRRKNRNGNN